MRSLLATQAQEYLGGKWSVATRLTGLTDAAMERALDAGRILRTHILRPTWHLVLPEDIRWLLALTSPRVLAQNGAMTRKLELDARTMKRALDVVARALEGGRSLTREEVGTALTKARVKDAKGQRLACSTNEHPSCAGRSRRATSRSRGLPPAISGGTAPGPHMTSRDGRRSRSPTVCERRRRQALSCGATS